MRPTGSIVRSLGRLSKRWLINTDPFRKKAIGVLMERSGFSRSMAEAALDATFKELTQKKLLDLLETEIGDPSMLDGFQADRKNHRLLKATAPSMILHIFSSNIPNAAIWSVCQGLLLRSRNVVKMSSKDEGIFSIYLESLKKIDQELASFVKILPTAHKSIEPYLKKADIVLCYGSDSTINQIRSRTPRDKMFVGYGHKVSFAILLKESLGAGAGLLARRLAKDAWMVDGRGCLSPGRIFVERGGKISPERFEELFQKELASLYYRGQSGVLKRSRSVVSVLRTQVYGFKRFDTVYEALSGIGSHLQAVALEGNEARVRKIALALSALGASRICRAGQMQTPPITWHHDGRSNLASWLTWTDLEY